MIAFGRRRGAAPENATTSSIAEILVTAITPALIMILIGSLVFFLISVFYVGEFQARLKYICALFVFATVLIGRISIEEGSEHAAIYGVGLGIAILLAMSRFSDAGLVINIALIAVVWFSAHKLTWDCTVLRQGKDASGQGLLQTAGLDDDDNDGPSQDLDAVSQTSDDDDDDQPTADLAEDEPANPLAALFQRWKEHRKRPHAPGVWVIYFCVASIPLFGMGQILMPSDPLTRRRAFLYLCVYVGAGLALLCATSFLSLRRYLRQRRLEMPPEMAATWSAVGAAMIVALLIFCMMLPRPNPEYSVSDWAPEWSSPISLNSSDWGWGEEGVKDREQADQSSQPEQQGDDGRGPQGKGDRDDQSTTGSQSGGSQSGNRQGKQQGGKQQGGKQQGGKQQGGKQQGGKQQGGKQQGGKQQGGKQQGGKQQGGKQQGGDRRRRDETAGDNPKGERTKEDDPREGPKSDGSRSQDDGRSENRDNPARKQRTESRNGARDQPRSSPRPPRTSNSNWLSNLFKMLGSGVIGLIQLLYWIVIFAVLVYVGFRYRKQIQAALRKFFEDLQRLWASLFGSKPNQRPTPAEEVAATAAAARAPGFADYPNPFANGQAQSMPPSELIRYSFEAFEAWARDRRHPRDPDQTPAEFCREAAGDGGPVAKPARILAELYNIAAYSGGEPPAEAVARLRHVWQALQSV